MRKLIVLISLISTAGFSYQAINSQTLTAWLAALASLIVFLTALANLKTNKNKEQGINQSIGDNSSGLQIGGNMTINEKEEK
ncbi:hypothetical protein [Pantoea ananatis]|uniref:hypothetical protein n=1 Tax=Pantoea ananas TaxID=553 RepID=UPI001B30DFA4|nr:hypothetical protein [Pantoea ananatis]